MERDSYSRLDLTDSASSNSAKDEGAYLDLPEHSSGFRTPALTPIFTRQKELTPRRRVEYNPDISTPLLWITIENPLEPMEAALQMCAEKHRRMSKSLRGCSMQGSELRMKGSNQVEFERKSKTRSSTEMKTSLLLESFQKSWWKFPRW